MGRNNAKICNMCLKMCLTYVVYVCSDISLSECHLGSMERWGREASKTELKDMFQLSNDKRDVLSIFRTHAQKEDITLFDSKSTSIHSSILQHVYTLKKKHCIHGRNGTRLIDDTLGAGLKMQVFTTLQPASCFETF